MGLTLPDRVKVRQELRELARQCTEQALKQLVHIAFHSKSDAVKLGAIKELLDRGHGRSVQAVEHSGETRITHEDALKLIGDRIAALDAEEAANEPKIH